MIRSPFSIALLPVLALATACSDHRAPLSSDFGDAVRQNTEMQVINPDPVISTDPTPSMNGQRALGAYERYLTDKVKPPRPSTITTLGGSSSSAK